MQYIKQKVSSYIKSLAVTKTRHLHFFCKMANVYYYYCFVSFTIFFSEINSQPTDYYLNDKADYFPYPFVNPQLNSLGNYPNNKVIS